MCMNVSSEHVAKTDFDGWQTKAFNYLECAAISTNKIPLGDIIFTYPFAKPAT